MRALRIFGLLLVALGFLAAMSITYQPPTPIRVNLLLMALTAMFLGLITFASAD